MLSRKPIARYFTTVTITEGSAQILSPSSKQVFYNPDQKLNRDLSVYLLRGYIKRLHPERTYRILDAFAATGIRSIRYLKELPNISHIIANDVDPRVTPILAENLKHNSIDSTKTSVNTMDANKLMQNLTAGCDIIDLDPYGSCVNFLESAINVLNTPGILCATFTDTPVVASNTKTKVCISRYGSVPPLKHGAKEAGARVLLNAINTVANKCDRSINPLLCIYCGFYYRLFVEIKEKSDSEQEAVHILSCNNCQYYDVYKESMKCPICGSEVKKVGPIWAKSMHNLEILKATYAEIGDVGDQKSLKQFLRSLIVETLYDARLLGIYLDKVAEDVDIHSIPMQNMMYRFRITKIVMD